MKSYVLFCIVGINKKTVSDKYSTWFWLVIIYLEEWAILNIFDFENGPQKLFCKQIQKPTLFLRLIFKSEQP